MAGKGALQAAAEALSRELWCNEPTRYKLNHSLGYFFADDGDRKFFRNVGQLQININVVVSQKF
jgi:hypothetical protein